MENIIKKNNFNKYELSFLIFIISLAAFLRFYHLGSPSLWNDELESWRMSSMPTLSAMFDELINNDVHSPGYRLFLYYYMRLFGDSEFILRLPSAIAGIIAVYFIFLVGRKLFSIKEGLISAALLSVLWCPLYYSQEARPYSMMLMLSLVTFYYWLVLLSEDRNQMTEDSRYNSQFTIYNFQLMIVFIISLIVLSYLHYYGLYFTLLLFVLHLYTWYKAKLKEKLHPLASSREVDNNSKFKIQNSKLYLIVTMCFVIVLLTWIPWIAATFHHLSTAGSYPYKPKALSFIYLLAFFNNYSPYILLIVICCWLNAFIKFIKNPLINIQQSAIKPELLIAGWLLIPSIAIILFSIFIPVFDYKSLIIILPASVLIAARSITVIFKSSIRQYIAASILSLLIITDLIINLEYYYNPYKPRVTYFGKEFKIPHKEPFREATAYLVKNLNNSNLHKATTNHLKQSTINNQQSTVIIACAWFKDYFDYYIEKLNIGYRTDICACSAADTTAIDSIIINKTNIFPHPLSGEGKDKSLFPVSGGGNIWLIWGHRQPEKKLIEYLNRHYIFASGKKFTDAGVIQFKNKSDIEY